MTELELKQEWAYRYQERLGILCGDGLPTEDEDEIARTEADECIAILAKE